MLEFKLSLRMLLYAFFPNLISIIWSKKIIFCFITKCDAFSKNLFKYVYINNEQKKCFKQGIVWKLFWLTLYIHTYLHIWYRISWLNNFSSYAVSPSYSLHSISWAFSRRIPFSGHCTEHVVSFFRRFLKPKVWRLYF